MPWTQVETAAFFTKQHQMTIPPDNVNGGLMAEGIAMVKDLEEFNDDELKAVQENLTKPAGTVPDTNNVNQRIPAPSSVLGAKSVKRLKVAAVVAVRYYQIVGRDIDAINMHYTNVLKNFGEQWDAIKQKEKDDEPNVPKITRSLPIGR